MRKLVLALAAASLLVFYGSLRPWFSGLTNGNSLFVGDYKGVAVGSDGKAWSAWTDQRADATNAVPRTASRGSTPALESRLLSRRGS